MKRTIRLTFIHEWYGDRYTIDFRWRPGVGHFTMFVVERPRCRYPVGNGRAHVLGTNVLCVAAGREPRTLSRAKALAMRWLHGFSQYRRSGIFPEDPISVDLKD